MKRFQVPLSFGQEINYRDNFDDFSALHILPKALKLYDQS